MQLCLHAAPSVHSGAALGSQYDADIDMLDDDEDWLRDLLTKSNEDEDMIMKVRFLMMILLTLELNWTLQPLQLLQFHLHCMLKNNFHNKLVSFHTNILYIMELIKPSHAF